MRLVYLGTPDAAVPPLRALVSAGHEIVLVVSQPDRKRGRGGALIASPVKQAARDLGLSVTDQVDDVLQAHRVQALDLGVVVAFGRLIKPHVLAELDFVNIHFSLLPRWRGAAPVERSILAGDTETGCCLMALEAGLDTGPVYRRVVTPIGDHESADSLRTRLVTIGTDMLVDALSDGLSGLGAAIEQAGNPTHAAKLQPAEFVLDFSRPAVELSRLVRIGNAHTTFRNKRVKILVALPVEIDTDQGDESPGSMVGDTVSTGGGGLRLVTVQPEGKQPMTAEDWIRGVRPTPQDRLGAIA
jgi:methionyl-tRNA formyltransferase